MKFLTFDINGKYAHFRKFYTNSSSTSYYFPSRTTIIGIIATILGFERDSYYNILNSQNCNISIMINNELRKINQTVNYVMLDGKRSTQIPLEIISAIKFNENISYRIFVNIIDKELYYELKECLENKKTYYPPYMGIASFSCNVEYLGEFVGEEKYNDDYINIHSPINIDYIKEINVTNNLNLIKERMAKDYLENRQVDKVCNYIFNMNLSGIESKLNCKYFSIDDKNLVLI